MAKDDRHAIQVARRRRVDEVLAAAEAGVEHVGHVREGDALLHARVVRGCRVVVPGAVVVGLEPGLVVLLRLGDDDLGVVQVGHAEVLNGARRLLGDLEAREVVVDGVGVVVPDPTQLVGRVADEGVRTVGVGLVVLGLDPDEGVHQCPGAIRVRGGTAGRGVVEGAALSPAPEDQVDARSDLDVAAEVGHVDRHRLSRGDSRRTGRQDLADVDRRRLDRVLRHQARRVNRRFGARARCRWKLAKGDRSDHRHARREDPGPAHH